MPEFYTNTASTTVSAAYSPAAGTITLGTTGGGFPTTPSFRIVVTDKTTGNPKSIFKVTSIPSTTTFLVTAEGTDVACSSGDSAWGVLSQGALDQIRQDVSQSGVNASLPSTASQTAGNLYHATDIPRIYRFDGSAWITQGTYVISSQSLGAAVTTVTFAAIPQVFDHLVLRSVVLGTGAASASGYIVYNTDTGTNYSHQFVLGQGAAASAGAAFNGAPSGLLVTDINASFPSMTEVTISNYSKTSFLKVYRSHMSGFNGTVTGSLRVVDLASYWNSTAAITNIQLVASAGSFAAGSVLTLYGWA